MYSLILGLIFDLESFILFIKFRVNLKRFVYYKSHEFESNNPIKNLTHTYTIFEMVAFSFIRVIK